MLLAIELGVAGILFMLSIIMLQLGSLKPGNMLINVGLTIIFLMSVGLVGIIMLDATSRFGAQVTSSTYP